MRVGTVSSGVTATVHGYADEIAVRAVGIQGQLNQVASTDTRLRNYFVRV